MGARAAWAAAGGRSRQERVAGGRAGRASVGGAVVRRGRAVVTECRSPISRCAHPHRDTHTRNTNTTFNKMCKRNMRVRAMCASVCVQGGDGSPLVVTTRTVLLIGRRQGGRSRVAARRFVSFQNLSKCFAFSARSAILHTPLPGVVGGADDVVPAPCCGRHAPQPFTPYPPSPYITDTRYVQPDIIMYSQEIFAQVCV